MHESVKGLKSVDELEIDGKRMIVVDADGEHLSVRTDAQLQDYKIEKLPTKMALYLAEQWLQPNDPNSKVVLGAFLAVDPHGNRQEARQLCAKPPAGAPKSPKPCWPKTPINSQSIARHLLRLWQSAPMKPFALLAIVTIAWRASSGPSCRNRAAEHSVAYERGPWAALGLLRRSAATTPNVDRLAAQGVCYLHCWSNAPVCARPARR